MKIKQSIFSILSLLIIVSCVDKPKSKIEINQISTFGDLGNGTYLNPIFPGDFPDPTIIRDGKDYYMTHTSHNNYPGLLIWHSRDLVNWKVIGSALKEYVGEIWAPDLIKYKGKYYIYCPLHDTGSNMVIVADNIEGPWSSPVDLNVKGLIDPGHIVGEDGKRYLFCSSGYMAELSDDGLSVIGELQKVYDGWKYPSDWLDECFCLESPKLKKGGDYYYMISAQGGTSGPATSHMAVMARSKSVFGPWENSPYNPIIHTYSTQELWWSKGHASIVDTPEGEWWIVYHAYKNNFRTLGRSTLLEPIKMTPDKWFVLDGSDPAKSIKMPSGENIGSSLKELGNFAHQFSNYRWQFYDLDISKEFKIKEDKLIVAATGKSPITCNPLLFTPINESYEATVEVSLEKEEDAGMMIFYGRQFYRGIGLSNNTVSIYTDNKKHAICKVQDSHKMHLKIINDRDNVALFYSTDGNNWQKVSGAKDVSMHTTNLYGGFRSLKVALFSYGEGETTFSNFQYK